MLRSLGAVQLDTISVLARSHELVAYARLGPTPRAEIESAYWSAPATAFEYYGHAGCIFPVEAWPYFSFRRRAHRVRRQNWFDAPSQTIQEVRARLREGAVTASDLGGAREGTGGWWSWSASKRAIELLYYSGEVICTSRRGWKRVYDLPERALPKELLAHEPADEECFNYFVGVAARALGIGTRRDIIDYFRLTTRTGGAAATAALVEAAIAGLGLVCVEVEGWKDAAYAFPAALVDPPVGRSRTTLLSPFDSLVWERKRTTRLFGFTFVLEAYVPREKREHGYFAMPLLAEGRIVGRVDPKREGRTLTARKVTLEDARWTPHLALALREAASWVGCDAVAVESARPSGLPLADYGL